MRLSRTIVPAALALSAGLAGAQSPVTGAFTFQGRLAENGAPASGSYDFNFALRDAAAGGAQVGFSQFIEDVPVTDGLFRVTLDYGTAAMNGQARWVEVQVRPGSSAGAYTTLQPRQPLTAAPYAVHALKSDQWKSVGAAVTNANAGFVGINRSSPVTGAEYFGIQAPVQSGYGGMYVRTDGAAAKPFYGYSTGSETAWTYLDGGTGNWNIYNGGDRLTVTDTGRVGIGTTSPTARVHVDGTGLQDAVYATASGSANAGELHLPPGTTGNALYAVTYGSGRAAAFESHVSNAEPAVSVFKNNGTAIKTTGDVEVEGQVRARMGSAMARATPIAFGKFAVGVSGTPIITSSSGNIIGFPGGTNLPIIGVLGETNPGSWMVTATLAYENMNNPTPYYRLVVGNPDANGQIKFYLKCVENCGSASNGDKYIHFVVYKP